jgi:hypothetical protein
MPLLSDEGLTTERFNHGEHGEHGERQNLEPLTTEAQRHREKQEKNRGLFLTFSVSLCLCG